MKPVASNLRRSIGAAAIFGLFLLGAAALRAQETVRVEHYRFVPRASTLDATQVGWERPDIQYRVHGVFDVEFGTTSPDPWAGQTAKFANVHAFADVPYSAMPPLDLNAVLNLTGLEGHQLPVAAPFDVFQFLGTTEDGSSVELFADVIGPWLRLHGGTTLPAGLTVGTEYTINAVARRRPFADFNDDGVVDSADLSVWEANFGSSADAGDATYMGDADGDLRVNGADFLAWQAQLGERAPGLAADFSATAGLAATVPESSLPALALMAMVAAVHARRCWGYDRARRTKRDRGHPASSYAWEGHERAPLARPNGCPPLTRRSDPRPSAQPASPRVQFAFRACPVFHGPLPH